MARDSGRGPGLRRMLRRGRLTVVPTVLMGCPRQAREKRVTISPAAKPPSRAQEESRKSPEMRHFRVTSSPATSPSPDSFRSRSIRIEIPRRPSRSQENHSAKSARKGFPSSASASPAPGVCWPDGQQMKNGGAEEIRTPDPRVANAMLYQLSYRPTVRSEPVMGDRLPVIGVTERLSQIHRISQQAFPNRLPITDDRLPLPSLPAREAHTVRGGRCHFKSGLSGADL